MTTVFFSYSHRDEALRDELETHLSALKRQGLIDTWHDRRIGAGTEWAREIDENLERADVILLLVSPYFISSDYCYDVEMRRAIERHDAGEARVIPVLLHPCDWHGTPFGKLQATPKDGKPVSLFANQHEAFLDITKAVRAAVEGMRRGTPTVAQASLSGPKERGVVAPHVRSSNLRLKKEFTDRDRDVFLDESFEYIARFFEGSLQELEQRNTGITTRFKRLDGTRFSAHVYKQGRSVAQCGIRTGGFLGSGIAYSTDPDSTNSFNESLSVADDGHTLQLKPMGLPSYGSAKGDLSQQGAAEYLWSVFVRPLQ